MELNLESLSKADKIQAIQLLEAKEKLQRSRKAVTVFNSFYDWQFEFVEATAKYHECCLCAANQIGKTFLGTDIDAMHLLGDYPDDWLGHRFESPPLVWCLGYSMEKTRDLLQTALFGELNNGTFSGGLIPPDRVISYQSASGTTGACRTINVKHRLGESTVQFWSYTQGQHAIMGDVVDFFHVDEEPRDQTIRPQLLTRTANGDNGKGGRGIYTFTPENGRTDLVLMFKDTPSPSQFYMQKGWDDAPHMTEEKKTRLLASYPVHQRDMRSKGEPMLGHGRIYEMSEESISIDPFPIPKHWRVLNGMDFGWDHPQSHAQIAWDMDNDVIYVTKAWKASQRSANDAWGIVKEWGAMVPCAWPQDGLQHEKSREDAVQQMEHYRKAGFQMLHEFAQWPMVNGAGGGRSVEQGLYEINERMLNGKFRVFSGLVDFFSEFRQYHRDERGTIVKINDDILDAVRYAYMMRRYAKPVGDLISAAPKFIAPQPIRVIGRG